MTRVATLELDPRLPVIVEIEHPKRQQVRRCTRKPTPCAVCHKALTAETLCLAAGHLDVHRSCAEAWNASIRQAAVELAEADAARAAEEADACATAQTPTETPAAVLPTA